MWSQCGLGEQPWSLLGCRQSPRLPHTRSAVLRGHCPALQAAQCCVMSRAVSGKMLSSPALSVPSLPSPWQPCRTAVAVSFLTKVAAGREGCAQLHHSGPQCGPSPEPAGTCSRPTHLRRPGAGALSRRVQPVPHPGHRLPHAAPEHGREVCPERRAAAPRDRPQRRLPGAAVPAGPQAAAGGEAEALGHATLCPGGRMVSPARVTRHLPECVSQYRPGPRPLSTQRSSAGVLCPLPVLPVISVPEEGLPDDRRRDTPPLLPRTPAPSPVKDSDVCGGPFMPCPQVPTLSWGFPVS